VRSLQLQAALVEFFAQAADRLQADVAAGREVPFELASQSARGRGTSPLYSYKPLTARFIAERLPELRCLEGYPRAAELLDSFEALERYLIASGAEPDGRGRAPRARADGALLALLGEIFDQQTDFDRNKSDQYEQRVERALERLEDSTFAAAGELTLVATLHGLTIASPELALARGLQIAHPDALQGAPEQALAGRQGEADHLLVVYSAQDDDPRAAIVQGREVLGELLRALRLFGDGRIALGALAWARTGVAPWSALALGKGGRPHGMLLVGAEQEDELRAFCSLVSRRAPQDNELAWALRRFELGCERPSEYEGLSDHLLALRALLGPASEFEPAALPDGVLAARLAALCATPEQRAALAERTLKAIALERQAIAGTAKRRINTIDLARELADHLRALLRDVICGHLPAELAELADELLLEGVEVGGFVGKVGEVVGKVGGDAGKVGEVVGKVGGEVGKVGGVVGKVGEEVGKVGGDVGKVGGEVEGKVGEGVCEKVGEETSENGKQESEQPEPVVAVPAAKRRAGRIAGSSGEESLGDEAQAAEVLHVAV
jgi:hypothetical protein